MAKVTEAHDQMLYIPEISQGRLIFNLLGSRPLILNRMSVKAWHELLLGGSRKTPPERQASLKHDPFVEFQASPYKLSEGPTLLAEMSSAFKGTICTAALDLPGATKTQIGRLVQVAGDYTPIYGIPKLFMSVVRSADKNRTPDIRTRAILPQWACRLEVMFVKPILNAQAITNLLTAAGVTVGVGDWRPEKGKGTYGQFIVVPDNDIELQAIMSQGREAQQAAMDEPECYDEETAEILAWWRVEARRRGKLEVA